jgi:flagellar biosynthesis chaperone FliJ
VRTFRFRAQAALELRRRELDDRQRDRASIERVRDAVVEQTREAERARMTARRSAATALRGVRSSADLVWHSSWMLRLDREWEALRARVRALDVAVAEAVDACVAAHRRCESLERLRTKARAGFDVELRATERRQTDELASQRFAAARGDAARGDPA